MVVFSLFWGKECRFQNGKFLAFLVSFYLRFVIVMLMLK